MTVFHDPNAPEGRVVFGGETFIDGYTADITVGPGTRELFAGAGITETAAPQLTEKEKLQRHAAELGLDGDGTKAEIQARIDEYRAAPAAQTEE